MYHDGDFQHNMVGPRPVRREAWMFWVHLGVEPGPGTEGKDISNCGSENFAYPGLPEVLWVSD